MTPDFNHDERLERYDDLRMENEIMKIKMQAETGGIFGGSGDLPPEIENIFLQHVQSFEEAWRSARQVTVFDKIGKPDFRNEMEMSDQELEDELQMVLDVLKKNHIEINHVKDYDSRIMYRLITEELFQMEISDVDLPGMSMHFSYASGNKFE
jgi:hypothetical protein